MTGPGKNVYSIYLNVINIQNTKINIKVNILKQEADMIIR